MEREFEEELRQLERVYGLALHTNRITRSGTKSTGHFIRYKQTAYDTKHNDKH